MLQLTSQADVFLILANVRIYLQECSKSLTSSPTRHVKSAGLTMGFGLGAVVSRSRDLEIQNGFDPSFETRNEYARFNGVQVVDGDDLGGKPLDFINTGQALEQASGSSGVVGHLTKELKLGGILKICASGDRYVKQGLNKIRRREDCNQSGFHKYLTMFISLLIHIKIFTARSIRAMTYNVSLEQVVISLRYNYALVRSTKLFFPVP